jgi:ribonuclease HI
MTERIDIFSDGGSRGNPGPSACAFVAVVGAGGVDSLGGRAIRRNSRYIGIGTNNEAEYNGLIDALKWAKSRGLTEVTIHSDSELLVHHLDGSYKVKAEKLKPLFQEAKSLLVGIRYGVVHHRRDHPWISRCDAMVNEALDDQAELGRIRDLKE